MNKLLENIEKHKFAIFGTLIVHLILFVYLLIGTYSQQTFYGDNEVFTKIDPAEEVIELNPENIETPPDQSNQDNGPVSSLTKNENDSRKSSSSNFSKSSIDKQVDEEMKNLEKSMFDEMSAKHPQSSEKSNSEKSDPLKEKPKPQKEEVVHGDGVNTQIQGKTMVSYNMKDRYPQNNNDWYIRNPGYTCGTSSNGTVVVDIKINQNGTVIYAKYNAGKSAGATTCMIEKGEEYALKSRFAFKSDAPTTQEGTITYRFVSK